MFKQARLKLTAWYLLIIMLVSLGFSVAIYKVLTFELNRFSNLQRQRLERRFFPEPPRILLDPELIAETRRRLVFFLLMVNGGILAVSGGLAYFLAGKTLQPIKQMLDEQNQFISDASHEFKTPLTSLKTGFEVYLRGSQSTQAGAKSLIKDSLEEVNKLQSLTEGLLQLAQGENYSHQLSFNQISLETLVKKALQRVKPQAAKKLIKIENKTTQIKFDGDSDALADLLVILLDNAIKYSPRGKTVTMTSKKTDGSLLLTVEDQGLGIAEKDLPHIFDRFYRTDTARSKDGHGGYGLGLAIAKKNITSHDGTITVKSKLNQGSVFTVRLPLSAKFQN